jgi:hypothetical protein
VEQSLPLAVGDAEMVRIVVHNLLNNSAVHAGEDARSCIA